MHLFRMSIACQSLVCLGLIAGASAVSGATLSGYTETTLQTNTTDPDLINPWGISESATSPFWLADNGAGVSTLYNSAGVKQGLIVSMPAGSSTLTGTVFNGSTNFNADNFLFATESGTITGWRSALGTTAQQLFSVTGAEYTGLAISSNDSTLYGADFSKGTIDVFSSTGLTGSFSDSGIPAGFAPFNIQNIGGTLFVTFAMVGPTGGFAGGTGAGFVAVFNPTTNTFTPLISQGGALDAPWGVAIAPNGFGSIGGDLLVGNFGNGEINVFNPTTGALIGTLSDVNSDALVNHGLWALQFGNGGNGGLANTLYITAGPNGQTGGLFAAINAPTPEPSTMLLSGVAGALLLAFRRRRKRSV